MFKCRTAVTVKIHVTVKNDCKQMADGVILLEKRILSADIRDVNGFHFSQMMIISHLSIQGKGGIQGCMRAKSGVVKTLPLPISIRLT